jgi:hypothetical protein
MMEEEYKFQTFLATISFEQTHDAKGSLQFRFIKQMNMMYEAQQVHSLESAREFVVKSTRDYLKILNETQEMPDVLNTTEIKSDPFYLRWSFRKLDDPTRFIREGHIAMVTLRSGKITYEVFNEEKRELELLHKESFEGACARVDGYYYEGDEDE